jgi:GNAT superfamily N-acetyltransferase
MIRIRLMTPADIALGMRLKTQAGWNQTEADWRRFLWLQPDGCFVAELDGTPVGTTACFVFGRVAWVAMVLVDEAVRGRGIGTALMRHALAFLDGLGVRSVRLDATPLGRPVYEKLGFTADYTLVRYAGRFTARAVPRVEALQLSRLPEAIRLDASITGADRSRLLRRLFEEYPNNFRIVSHADRLVGFLAARPGAHAVQVGPVLATDRSVGRCLFFEAASRHAGQQVFIDVPQPNAAARRSIEALGLAPQRELVRMNRGQPLRERLDNLWASSGPEKG